MLWCLRQLLTFLIQTNKVGKSDCRGDSERIKNYNAMYTMKSYIVWIGACYTCFWLPDCVWGSHMYMWMLYMSYMCAAHVCGGQGLTLDVFLSYSSPYIVRIPIWTQTLPFQLGCLCCLLLRSCPCPSSVRITVGWGCYAHRVSTWMLQTGTLILMLLRKVSSWAVFTNHSLVLN